jgi:hypothetical protein
MKKNSKKKYLFNYPGLDERQYKNIEDLAKSSKQKLVERFIDFEELLDITTEVYSHLQPEQLHREVNVLAGLFKIGTQH